MSASIPFSRSRRPVRAIVAALLLCTVAVTGCSSKYGAQQTKVNHYPDCYDPIAELRKSEYGVEKSTAAGAVLGGLLGALGGYIATGKAEGAVIGAAAGAAVGAAGGYYQGKTSQDAEDQARMDQYSAELDANINEIDKSTAAAKVARMCYERQFAVAVSEFKAGHITKEQFNSRYTEVSSGLEEAAFILGENNKYSEKVAGQYRQAVNNEAERMGVPQQALNKKKKPAASNANSGSKTAAAKPQPKMTKAEERQAAAQLNTDEGKQLSKLNEKTENIERSVEASQEEERLMRERLAATHKAAEDLMS